MTLMIEFSAALLRCVADFLASEPIVYLYSLVLLCFLCKVIKSFLS